MTGRFEFASRVFKAANAMQGKGDPASHRLLGILAGVKLARDYPDAAEAFIVQIGATMDPSATAYITNLVEFIGTGHATDAQIQEMLDHIPED